MKVLSSSPLRPSHDDAPEDQRAEHNTTMAKNAPPTEHSPLPGIVRYLREHHPQMCRQWFEELTYIGHDGLVCLLRAHSDIHTRYLHNTCHEAFTEALQAVTGELRSVRFLGPDDHAPRVSSEHDRDSRANNAQPHMNGHAEQPQYIEPRTTIDPHKNGSFTHSGPEQAPNNPNKLTSPDDHARHNGEASPSDKADRTNSDDSASHTAPAPAHARPPRPAFIASYRSHQAHTPGPLLNPDYTFDHFVVGPENKMAHAAAVAVAEAPGRAYNPLFVHGGVGLGKSHLLQAACLRILDADPDTQIHYISCGDFSDDFIHAVQTNTVNEFRQRFRTVDVLVIDDIHFLTKRDQTQEEFFHTFNALYGSARQIVLSSDAPPRQIPDLEQRLVSRFSSGLVVEVMPPGYETRVQIVKRKAALRSIDMPADAACYIAAKVDTNIREIEGAITRVHVQSITDGRAIDENLARRALGAEADEPRPEIRLASIIDVVTAHYDVKMSDLVSKKKPRSIALPRQVCMYFAREHTRLSLQEVGAHFGGRDHTTVMHAHKVIAKQRGTDTEFNKLLESLEARF